MWKSSWQSPLYPNERTNKTKTNNQPPWVVRKYVNSENLSSPSAPLLSGWRVTVANATSSSISIQWTNLTSLVSRQARNYIVFLNRDNESALASKITYGNQLTTEITGLSHSTNYTVLVIGVDELGQPYRSMVVNATTQESKESF